MHDPVAAAAAHRVAASGPWAEAGLGRARSRYRGPWRVAALSDGRFRGSSAMLRAAETTMGPTALLARAGVEVLVASIRQQPIHREVFTHIGVDLASRAIVALKSSAHFVPAFKRSPKKCSSAFRPA